MCQLKIILTLVSALISACIANAQEERKLARQGNKAYEKQEFTDAEIKYRKALEENPSYPEGQFNLGDAIYKQQRYEESIQPFEQILTQTESEEMKAWTHHNMGNAQLKAKKYEESIKSYKNALRIRPNDMDTKYNLAYAQRMLKEQEQNGNGGESEEQETQDQENQEQQNDQQEQNEENQDQQNQENQQQNQEGGKEPNKEEQQNDEGEQKSNQEQQQPRPNQLTKEEAERILQALENEERKVQAKVQKEKGKASKIYIEKDW